MGIVFMTGFEDASWSENWSLISGWQYSTQKPRTGSGSLKFIGAFDPRTQTEVFGTSSYEMVFGYALYIPEAGDYSQIFNIRNRYSETLCYVRYYGSSGTFRFYNSAGSHIGTSIVGSRPGINSWNYVELAVKMTATYPAADATETMQFWLNGEEIFTYAGAVRSAGTTLTLGDKTMAQMSFGSTNDYAMSGAYVDDLYVATGLTPLGDCGLYRIPIIGAGSATTWTATGTATGTFTNWECVDDTTSDDNATYVQTATVGAKDYYALQNVTAGPTIYAVSATFRGTKLGTGTRAARVLLKDGANVVNGHTMYLPYQGYKTDLHNIWNTKPGGGDWDQTALDNIEVGIELVE